MKQTYLYGAMALGLLFASCSSDKLSEPEQNNVPLDAEQSFYVCMRISGDVPEGTRAAADNGTPQDSWTTGEGDDAVTGSDFDAGTNESKVNNAYFVFYDNSGNVVGDIVSIELNNDNLESTASGATVEQSYKSVVAVSVRKGEKQPSQVICYINPISPGSLNVNLNMIQTVARSDVKTESDGETYFAMSNSVYYPDGEAEDSTPQIAVNIDGKLFNTENEAKNADETKTAVIYVERYASKLEFSAVNPTAYQTASRVYAANGTYTTIPIVLNFSPQYWAVNAQSNRTYVIKSFRQESEDGTLLGADYQYSNLNKYINPTWNNSTGTWNYTTALSQANAWDWNNPDYHRSFWGMSPAYFTKEYPEVSSDVTKLQDDLNQTYLKYNELVTKGFSATNTNPQYFKETTVGSRALNGKNPAAAVASVIYVGQYSVSVNGTAAPVGSAFYSYLTGPVTVDGRQEERPYIYFDRASENSAASAVTGGESMLKRFLAQTTILYKAEVDEENNVTGYTRYSISNPTDLTKLATSMKVDKISDAMKIKFDGDNETELKVQANARTLQFKNVAAAEGIYVLTGNGYQQVVADDATIQNGQITLTEANIALMRQAGMAYYYTTGHAYFNIPVKHLGWYRNGNTQKTESNIDWSKVRVGDFGMVRNHSYKVNVSEIKGLASGIGDDTDPIVPPATPNDYFISYSVKILKWAVVPAQDVKL